ncbi:hypothetical protein BH18ACI4_BH18ACI4_08580 [soil metagenome]
MRAITAPISREEPRDNRTAILSNLQTALLLLLRGGVIPVDRQAQPRLEDDLQREQSDRVYGDITEQLVTIFQQQFPRRPEIFQPFFLIVTGKVDAATAIAMNQRLFDLHALRLIEGTVTNREGNAVAGNQLVAFDKDNIDGDSLAKTNANDDGAYFMFYDPLLYSQAGAGVLRVKRVIDLVVQVRDDNGATLAASQPLPNPDAKVRVNLMIGDIPDGQSFILRGQVLDANGPVNDIQLDVFDRDLFFRRDGGNGGQRLNPETLITKNLPPKNEDGCFELMYTTADFAAGDTPKNGVPIPDLVFDLSKDEQALKFQVYRLADGHELAEETLVSEHDLIMGIQARKVEEVRIVIDGLERKTEISEYERLIRAIASLLPEQIPAAADDAQRETIVRAAVERFDEEKHRDISFVSRETGFDRVLIQALVAAFALAADPFQNEVPPYVLYGLSRRRATYDFPGLARLSTADMRLALTEATALPRPIIPAFESEDELRRTVANIRDVVTTRLPNFRTDAAAPSLSDLLGNDLPNIEDHATLWRTYSDHEGTTAEFWEKLRTQPGFDEQEKIARVQYAFQLGLLAQDNLSLINEVRSKHPTVIDTRGLAFVLDTKEKWETVITDGVNIPDDVPGKPEERKANYAASLAVAVQVAHPTVAVANMVAALPAEQLARKQPAVAKFLADAVRTANFDLVSGRIDDLVSEHGESLLSELDVDDRAVVIDQVKRLQRLFRLGTDPKSMKVLLDTGFSSAREIASLPREVAMEMLTPELDEPTARLIINRANNISAAAVHQYVLLNEAINGEVPGCAL